VHYIEQGQGDALLCLHGEPSWSYLYRNLIPPLSASHRVLAMDFIGFGRSDKFPDPADYSFQLHRDTLTHFINRLDLQDLTLIVHDWGGLIGLTVASQMPERIGRLVIMNTGLPIGEEPMPEAYHRWRAFAGKIADLPIRRVIRAGLAHPERLSPAELAGYEAPFRMSVTRPAPAPGPPWCRSDRRIPARLKCEQLARCFPGGRSRCWSCSQIPTCSPGAGTVLSPAHPCRPPAAADTDRRRRTLPARRCRRGDRKSHPRVYRPHSIERIADPAGAGCERQSRIFRPAVDSRDPRVAPAELRGWQDTQSTPRPPPAGRPQPDRAVRIGRLRSASPQAPSGRPA